MGDSPITSVSDTARWVAVYRAWESDRPDALFKDPFAKALAGRRGEQIAALMPASARNGWPLIVRTKLIDDLTRGAVASGCDCVLNLAAGLDTRPYRLDLPATLRWVEADLPALMEEKERLLASAEPRCRLQRVRVDLSDAAARRALLDEIAAQCARVLVISEGLLVYLEDREVRDLSADLRSHATVEAWIFDLASPGLVRFMGNSMGAHLRQAPMKFGPLEGVAYFEALGWEVTEIHSLLRGARQLNRLPWFLRLMPPFEPNPRRPGSARWSAVVKLRRR